MPLRHSICVDPLTSSEALESVHRLVRKSVDFYEVDRAHQPDIEAVDNLLWDGKVLETAAQALEGLE